MRCVEIWILVTCGYEDSQWKANDVQEADSLNIPFYKRFIKSNRDSLGPGQYLEWKTNSSWKQRYTKPKILNWQTYKMSYASKNKNGHCTLVIFPELQVLPVFWRLPPEVILFCQFILIPIIESFVFHRILRLSPLIEFYHPLDTGPCLPNWHAQQ